MPGELFLGGRIIVMLPLLSLLHCRRQEFGIGGAVISGIRLLVLLSEVQSKLLCGKLHGFHLVGVFVEPRKLFIIGRIVIIVMPFMIVLWVWKKKY